MKHREDTGRCADVVRLARCVDVGVSGTQARDLVLYLDLVLDANRAFNLTAIRDPAEALRLHLVDSLSAVPEVSGAAPGAIVDIGTGAGFPGVPLAIVTGRPVVLLESVGKKARFLATAVEALAGEYDISVERGRAEEYSRHARGRFAVATARALAALPAVLELATPLLLKGGVCVAMKGPMAAEELAAGDAAASSLGLRRISTREFVLPDGGEARCVVVYERVAGAKLPLPRPVGHAQSRPLVAGSPAGPARV